MNTMIITLAFVVLFYIFFIRAKKLESRKIPNEYGKYHSVSICFDKMACSSIKQYQERRILSSEAPVLPLNDCDTEQCNCRFLHYKERRQEERRGAYNKALNDIAQNTMSITPRSTDDRRK